MQNEAQNILELMLANLFDDEQSKLSLMGEDIITEDMIPSDWKFHQAMLKAFYEAENRSIPPTPENIALLSLLKGDKTLERVKSLQERQKSASGSIRAYSVWFRDWLAHENLNKAIEQIERLKNIEYADVHEKHDQILDRVIAAMPRDSKESYTRISLIENLEDIQRKRVERRKKGLALGGVWHLEGLRKLTPVMRPTDLTLFTAPTKAGKTLSLMELAEYNTVHNDVDVLVLLLETSAATIEERFLAKHLLIPGDDLVAGLIDLDDPRFAQPHREYKERQQNIWDELGRMYIEYVEGAKVSEIATQIRIHKRLADARNRPLIVMIDYLQRMAEVGGKTSVESLASIAQGIKDLAVRYGVHIVLISQETFSAVGKENGDSRPGGSNTPIQVAQVHVALRVLNSDAPIYRGDENGNQLYDAVGNKRIYQFQGKKQRQSIIRYDIIRLNNGQTGNVHALVENPLFIIEDISPSIIQEGDKFTFDPSLGALWQKYVSSFESDLQNPERRLI